MLLSVLHWIYAPELPSCAPKGKWHLDTTWPVSRVSSLHVVLKCTACIYLSLASVPAMLPLLGYDRLYACDLAVAE